ncbi:5133_t:CDS:1 [Racocetra persica]|uniref:5133_t:CDS:1 n=1 Tax=Racocetra persica TaxID=160502 RepID=A0ACA9RVL6_9GLOM|nr:5133_t:CDS:1 [Racocetra persica]
MTKAKTFLFIIFILSIIFVASLSTPIAKEESSKSYGSSEKHTDSSYKGYGSSEKHTDSYYKGYESSEKHSKSYNKGEECYWNNKLNYGHADCYPNCGCVNSCCECQSSYTCSCTECY